MVGGGPHHARTAVAVTGPHGPEGVEGATARSPLRAIRWGRSARPLGVLAGAVAALTYLGVVDPHAPGHYPPCPFLWLTGLYCPGCGALRALHDLAHLDVVGAWGMNPLALLALPILGFSWVAWLRRAALGRERVWVAPARVIWILFAAVVVFGVARNLPAFAPWLAP